MMYTAYVIELKRHSKYKVYIDNAYVCDVNAKTYDLALRLAIECIFDPDCAYDYDFYAVGGLRSGQPIVQYYVFNDE